ncbi:MAG TPA: hypothetical protein VM864_13670 [Pyrinomonadaceae bacterium]|jgi:hypothetical protein|nr:hypothetical protein [Pyrinomonadaceae bacterium]
MNRAGHRLLRGAKQTSDLFNSSFGILTAAAILLTAVFGALLAGRTVDAANPATATLTPTSTQVTWQGTATAGGAIGDPALGAVTSEDVCVEGVSCDTFTLTVGGTPADWAAAKKLVHVHLGWTLPVTDYDLYIHKGNLSGEVVATSGQGATNPTGPLTSEDADLDPTNPSVGTGTFAVHVVYYAATQADQYSGTASVVNAPAPTPTPTPSGTPVPVSSVPAPRFFNYADPFNHDGGEPSLGINWKTGNVMFVSSLKTLRVQFDDATSPARANWADKSFTTTSTVSLDPILFTDPKTGRTFVSQLLGKASAMAYTDDDGETYTPSQGSGINSGVDHQTIGGGPFAAPLFGVGYSNAVYYASQDIATAEIALSVDGGLTFGPAIPMYALTQCVGIHGHVKVAPDGTVYVPNRDCGGAQGFAVSKDNGLTWEVKTAPNSHAGNWDPSIGIGADGTVYFGYGDADRTPRMVVYNPQTDTWANDQAVGGATAFTGVAFPALVAGDSDRAAFAFLGTTTPGSPFGTALSFTGVWHLYVATTYDRGASYTFTDVTPNDPVQRGNICDNGTTCPSDPRDTRNLLDFMDVQIDQKGRVLVGYADGCVTAACIAGQDVSGSAGAPDGAVNSFDNDGTALATIARQSGGKSLFSRFDAELGATTPAAPQLVASTGGQSASLAWTTPDDGGSAITGYKVFRSATATGANLLVATVGGDVNSYTDNAVGASYYSVQAVNANGAGALSPRVKAAVLESACALPGVTAAVDLTDGGQNTPLVKQVDLQSVSVAEPYMDGAQKLVFTLKLGAGGVLPPNSQWYVIWNRPVPDATHDRDYVAMRTDLAGTPSFEYGRISYPLVYTAPAANQGNLPTRRGAPDAGAYDAATGTVRITVSRAALDDEGNIGPGKTLTSIEARSFLGRNDALPINQNVSSDYTATGKYVVAGNNACQPPPPAAPTGLKALSVKDAVQLIWVDGSDEASFSIERSTRIDMGFAEVATVGQNATGYTDRISSRGKPVTYYYRVRAVRGTARSGYSNTAAGRAK